MKRLLFSIFTIFLVICLCVPASFAENDDTGETAEQPEQQEVQPETEEPVQEQSAEPVEPEVPAEPAEPEQPEESAEQAEPEPTQNETIPAEPEPEDYGSVDLVIYAYNSDGTPAVSAKVQIDETVQLTNDEGRASFPDLTVESHNLSITNDDGDTYSVLLYMSRGGSTQSTGVAQGGTCGLDIARGVSQVYMTVDMSSNLGIKLSDNKPNPPAVTSSEASSDTASDSSGGFTIPAANSDASYQTKQIYATFNDKNGKGIGKLSVTVITDEGDALQEDTNNSGRAEFEEIPYGTGEWSFDEEYDGFELELRKGVQTGVISGEGSKLTVSASPRTQRVYLTFSQSGDGFILEEASETGSGMSLMFLVIIIAVIVIGVIITVVLVKKYAGRKPAYAPKTKKVYNTDNYTERKTPRATGGSNKLNGNPVQTKKSDKNFDDRYRM